MKWVDDEYKCIITSFILQVKQTIYKMGVKARENNIAHCTIDDAINNLYIEEYALQEGTSIEDIMEHAIQNFPPNKSIAAWRSIRDEYREKLAIEMFIVATYSQNFGFALHLQDTHVVSVIDIMIHVIRNIPDEQSYYFWKIIRGNPGKYVAKELFCDACVHNKPLFAYLIHQTWGPWTNKRNIDWRIGGRGCNAWMKIGFYGDLYWHAYKNKHKRVCQVLEMVSQKEQDLKTDIGMLKIVVKNFHFK